MSAYQTNAGGQIYRIPLRAFPWLWGNAYLVLVEDYRVLIDTGSGYGKSHEDLETGLRAAGRLAGIDLDFSSLTHILITHGHIDHFGGLSSIRSLTSAKIGIHELDRAAVADHEERLAVVARRLQEFLVEAGVPEERRGPILEMHALTKVVYQSVPVDFTYEAQGMHLGPFRMLHVPGHCPGQVVIRLHDVLFSGDHILENITPHQAPERMMSYTGLGHYLESLEHLRPWSRDVRLTLGGHKGPITHLSRRLDTIRSMHMHRLRKVQDLLVTPHTVAEVSRGLFGSVQGYNILMALEETGAHIEYLYQRGLLCIENLADLEQGTALVPIRYQIKRK